MSNEIKTRPLTPTEQKYTYAQSMQLEGQTGTIGHLRGDFATTGYGFYTTWFDTRPQWKSDEFKADLDTVINGCGFSKNILSKATNPYFTEEENHSEHFGLGLYICKILCEHHGGYLKIENCSIGAKVTAFFKSLD